MEARAEHQCKSGFVLKAAVLSKMWNELQENVGQVKATVSCADKIERTFSNLEELTAYENSRIRQIQSLEFAAHSADRSEVVYLQFKNSIPSITLRAEGKEPNVSRIKDNLVETIDGVRAWYSSIARVGFLFFLLILMGFLYFSCIVIFLMSGEPERHTTATTFSRALLTATAVIAFLLCLVLLAWVLNKLRSRFFPVATFAIGQGETRYCLDEKIRWVVLVGFAVSVFASLVVAFLI